MMNRDDGIIARSPGDDSTPHFYDVGGGGQIIPFPTTKPRARAADPGNGGSNSNTSNNSDSDSGTSPDDFSRFADVLKSIVGQQVYVPQSGDPIAVPTATTASSALPLIIIVVAVAAMAYLYYKKNHQHKSGGEE
jgi:hypothetical protein